MKVDERLRRSACPRLQASAPRGAGTTGSPFPEFVRRALAAGPGRAYLDFSRSKAGTRLWKVLLGGNLVLAFALSRLDASLAVLHDAGVDGHGISALSDSAQSAAAALEQWDDVSAELHAIDLLRSWIDGTFLATLYSLLGLVFAITWPLALAHAAVWLCDRLGTEDPSPRARPVRVMLAASLILLPAVSGFGALENLARLAVVWVDAAWASIVELFGVLKWLLAVPAVVPAIAGLALLAKAPSPKVRGFFRALVLLRIHLLAVAAFGLLVLVVSTKDQAQDVLRTWAVYPYWAVTGVAAVVVFAASTGMSAARVLAVSRNVREEPPRPTVLMVVGAVTLLAGVALVFGWGTGVGVAIAGGIVLVVGAASFVVRTAAVPGVAGEEDLVTTAERPVPHPRPPRRAATHSARTASREANRGIASGPVPTPEPGDAEDEETNVEDEGTAWPTLAALLAAAPPLILGLAAVLAVIPEVFREGPIPFVPGLAALLLVFVLPFAVYRETRKRVEIPAVGSQDELLTRDLLRYAIGPGLVIAVALVAGVVADPLVAGRYLGAIAFVGFFLAGLMFAVMAVAHFAHRYSPPAALEALGFRRIPILLLILVWGVAGVWTDGANPLHDARLMRTASVRAPVDLDDYVDGWITSRTAAVPPAGAGRPGVPLVFVASSGGGIKAATWTALVVDCAFGRNPHPDCRRPDAGDTWPALFALSGASGGSVGLASALAEHRGDAGDEDWVARRLGGDLASASLGWQLFAEAPLTLFRLRPGGRDRAEILEEAWSSRWAGVGTRCGADPDGNPAVEGLFALHASAVAGAGPECTNPPPLFFPNGTSLVDGCRFNNSVLDAAPPFPGDAQPVECRGALHDGTRTDAPMFAATRDLADLLCADEDVSLATAAFLSARFPFFSPTGRVAGPEKRGRDCAAADPSGVVFVGDGGYRDNTGASTLLELWDRVRPAVERHNRDGGACLVPYFVHIESGVANRSAPRTSGRLFESIGPITGGMSAFGARYVAGPQLAASWFSGPLPGGEAVRVAAAAGSRTPNHRFFSFSLRAHPGVQAPLGWSLSSSAQEDLHRQLEINRGELERLYAVLTPGNLICEER